MAAFAAFHFILIFMYWLIEIYWHKNVMSESEEPKETIIINL